MVGADGMMEERRYKGRSLKDATTAYHAEAVTGMADRGFVPASEQWGEFPGEHHVVVVYEHPPQDVAAARGIAMSSCRTRRCGRCPMHASR